MLFKIVLTSFVSLALIHGLCPPIASYAFDISLTGKTGAHALPQVTTALPFNVVSAQDPSANNGVVSGEIIGTGSAGTTFVLSAATATCAFSLAP